uniref:ATP synthase CF1 delta subunit n=1 Tax=Bangiopsis subsimplex TaxID=139980 RepID=A0A1C9CCT1_9RHOD|nr:ATP synthase CF1 delta subunit [Bangiopsis subsimplex]AOM66203.1 ATP synthase CF1 delta subunit [Bangiopsis subsimplex]ARO90436.1 ATP synthase CF1 subunit delta [Bangiopsis subsimplex]
MSSKTVIAKIAQPYAEALLEISTNNISEVNHEVKLIADTLSNSTELKTFFANPIIPGKAKKELLNKLFSKDISKPVLNFLMILADRGRLSILNFIIEKYLELSYKTANVVLAKVVASISLTEEQQKKLITKLKSMTQSSEVELITEIDPNLIGGLTIQIGSQIIDTSLQGQIRQMSSHLDIV